MILVDEGGDSPLETAVKSAKIAAQINRYQRYGSRSPPLRVVLLESCVKVVIVEFGAVLL